MYNILVTGCGGDIGQSIGKILNGNPMFGRIIGCDMDLNNAGIFIFPVCLKLPSCRSDSYLNELEKIVNKYEIDIIIPASEPELRYFAELGKDDRLFNKILICANLKSMNVGFDKLLTTSFLKDSKLPYPITHVVSEIEQPNLPLILKSRNGAGSKSIFVVNDIEAFDFYKKRLPYFIGQELIGTNEDEYTCGLFRDRNNNTRQLIYKRKLTGGFSGFGAVVENEIIKNLLNVISIKLDLRGSINVQLRLSNNEPYVFEINPRFSSTVMFRHLMGFEDLIWSILDKLEQNIPDYNPPFQGRKFYKGFNEYVD